MRNKDWLKKMREIFGISQKQLSEESGVNKNTIENIEQSKRKGSDETWKEIERYFSKRILSDNVYYSYDSEELIQEIKQDIFACGKDKKCILFYKIIDNCFIFTNYDFYFDENDAIDEDYDKVDFNPEKELREDEYYLITTFEKALEVFEKQNEIL